MTGVMAAYSIWLRRKEIVLPTHLMICVVLYLMFCLLSLLVHPSFMNVFGSTLVRLGSLELIACVICGFSVRVLKAQQLLSWLYGSAVLLAMVTIPYQFLTIHHLARLGGTFHQSDILAVWMACGLLLGFGVWRMYPKKRLFVILAQAILLLILLLSQTRAVIVLLAVVTLWMIVIEQKSFHKRLGLSLGLIGSLAIGILLSQTVLPHRLTDTHFATQSTTYRLSLQKYAVKALVKQPLWGFGAGSLPSALACPTLHAAALQATCHEGHYFDSSHNIFLDRFLALGWLGGIAFITIVVSLLVTGLRKKGLDRIFTYCALLISLYYFTNVASLTVELLLWIFLFRSFSKISRA